MSNAPSAQAGDDERHLRSMPAYDEIISLLARAPDVLEFKPSEKARNRVWDLVAREKEGSITEDEKHELDRYGQIEHVMRLVKARARKQSAK